MNANNYTVGSLTCLVCLVGCGSSNGVTYHRDVRPIVEQHCAGCHDQGGIAPFSLLSYTDVQSRAQLISAVVSARIMPPWAPDDACNSYRGDRSLSTADIQTITNWVNQGAPAGDPATYKERAPLPGVGLSRVDLMLEMPQPFTPTLSPDQYRCFLIDWPVQHATHVTGFGVSPGAPSIVHHAIAFIASPSQVPTYEQLDAADPGPGYTCFGGPGGGANPGWMGAWVPGALGSDMPAGSGIAIQPGSKIVLQVHYNTLNNPAVSDQSQLAIKIDDTVDKEGVILPFTNPQWIRGNMLIPANAPDTKYQFVFDPTPYFSLLTHGVLQSNVAYTIYDAALHMHTRGAHGVVSVQRADGSEACLLRIPKWDFRWQGAFGLANPLQVQPGDQLSLECHWDNSAANQPVVNGQQVSPIDLKWGEGTENEMCLGVLYATQ